MHIPENDLAALRNASDPQTLADKVHDAMERWGESCELLPYAIEAALRLRQSDEVSSRRKQLMDIPRFLWTSEALMRTLDALKCEFACSTERPYSEVADEGFRIICEFSKAHAGENVPLIIAAFDWLVLRNALSGGADDAVAWLRRNLAQGMRGELDKYLGRDTDWWRTKSALWVKLFKESPSDRYEPNLVEMAARWAMDGEESEAELHYIIAQSYERFSMRSDAFCDLYRSGAQIHYLQAYRQGDAGLKARAERRASDVLQDYRHLLDRRLALSEEEPFSPQVFARSRERAYADYPYDQDGETPTLYINSQRNKWTE